MTLRTARFTVPPDHPCLPGHFPGHPVVPGVVLLDEAMRAAGREAPARLPAAKFLRPVLPGKEVVLTFREPAPGRLAFAGHVDGTLAFQGEIADIPAA